MRESLMYGSVRGTRGNSRPYRDTLFAAVQWSAFGVRREKGGAFQWVQGPPGKRSSRKQPGQLWR